METLEEVLVRTLNMSREDARIKIKESQELIASGMSPEEVLVREYGIDISYLERILDSPSIKDALK